MSSFPGTPKVQHGAILSIDLTGPPRPTSRPAASPPAPPPPRPPARPASRPPPRPGPRPLPTQVIPFQYNPDTMTRSLKPQNISGQGNREEVYRLKGPPIETISLDAEFDATNMLAQPSQNPIAVNMGIYPQLSALEVLVYPPSSLVIANNILASSGTIEIVPTIGPFTVFMWGSRRVVPVRLTDFRITEEAYDVNLNPIRAKVSLGMQVMTYDDFDVSHPGYSMFMAYQVIKETMAAIGSLNSLSAATSNRQVY